MGFGGVSLWVCNINENDKDVDNCKNPVAVLKMFLFKKSLRKRAEKKKSQFLLKN